MSIPSHQRTPRKTYSERFVHHFKEWNEHFDNTVNQMHIFSLLTDVSTNEVFTFREAMKQEDRLDFVAPMEKEIEDHKNKKHWSIVKQSSLPKMQNP